MKNYTNAATATGPLHAVTGRCREYLERTGRCNTGPDRHYHNLSHIGQ